MHGNQINKENKISLSFNFRVFPKSFYKENDGSSFSQNIDFKNDEHHVLTNIGNFIKKRK